MGELRWSIKGVKVYTIGVGSSGIAAARVNDPQGRTVVTHLRVQLDEGLLRKIAAETGGQYFNVKNPKGLEEAMAQIDTLERTEIDRTVFSRYDELFTRFLVPGIALLALGTVLGVSTARRVL